MEAKVECERILVLCHGCLSADRKISCVTGRQNTLFTKLRGDKSNENDKELLLCWECKALLNKTQQFQNRIKSAQKQLADYFNCCMHDKKKFNTYTQLSKTINSEYDYTYIYEEEIYKKDIFSTQYEVELVLDTKEELILDEEDNLKEENGELLQEIKEGFDNPIKDEVESLNNYDNYDDIDFYDTGKEDDLLQKKEKKNKKFNVSDVYDTDGELEMNLLQRKRKKKKKTNVSGVYNTESERDEEDVLLQKSDKKKRKISVSVNNTEIKIENENDLLQKKENKKKRKNISDGYDTKGEIDKEDNLVQKKERNINLSDDNDTESEMDKDDDFLPKKEKRKNKTSNVNGTESGMEKEDKQEAEKKRKEHNDSRKKYATIRVLHKSFTDKVESFCDIVNLDYSDIEKIKVTEKTKYVCKTCNVKCRGYVDYVRHNVFSHTEPSKNRVGLDQHIRNVHKGRPNNKMCHHCGKGFPLQYPTPCKICKEDITSDSHLHTHWKQKHNIMMKCKFCGDICRNKGELKKHLNRTHTRIYTCDKCAQEFPTLGEFSEHYHKVHEFFWCDYCQAKYRSKQRLEAHINYSHIPHQCPLCEKSFRSYSIFIKKHVKYYHPESLDKLNIRSKVKPTSKELRYCVECDKQFASVHLYNIHIKSSVKHAPRSMDDITCPVCKKSFNCKTSRNDHYAFFHTKKTKFYCEMCNKYYARSNGLSYHLKNFHQKISKPKDKICDICGRGFHTNRTLRNHRRTHTGERPHKCQYCSAAFGQKTAMFTHMKTQHKDMISSSSHQQQDVHSLTQSSPNYFTSVGWHQPVTMS